MTAKPAIGDQAPGFDLPGNSSGKTPGYSKTSLTALKGKKIVLYFYPKDDTPGCTKEAIEFTGLKAQFAGAGVIVIGVSPDDVKAHDKFIAKHGLDLTLLSDVSKAMLETYGVWVEKSMYGRKYMGVERTTFLIGADGKIVQVWNKVRVAGHAQAVLEAAKYYR